MKPKGNSEKTKFIIIGVIYVILFLMTAAASSAMEADASLTFINAMMGSLTRIMSLKMNAFFPSSPKFGNNLLMVSMVYGIGALLYHLSDKANKRMAPGKENGSAEWNTNLEAYDKQYTYPYGKPEHSYDNNVILTQNVFLGTDGRQTKRNLNSLIIGGSGAGKSRFYVKPNLLQAGTNSSFVITDPSGELLESCGSFLESHGYKIMVLNLTNMGASFCYNPFEYIRKEEDVLVLINCLIKNTTPPGSNKGDPFWEKSETALLTAIFFYLRYHRPEEDRSFTSVMKLLRAANIDENDSSSQSPLDVIFEEIGQQNPNDIGYKSYMTFRMGAGKTLKSILISCAVRLNAFEIPAVAALVRTDYEHPERNINLKQIGYEKTALFCILPQADDTYNFIVSMMYYQLFESLYYFAEHEKGGLKYNVRFMLDEFCNIGQIPDFDKKLATMRKYGLSCSIIVQNLKQLEEMYDKKTEGLIGNCDSILFLGSSEYSTLEFISKKLGDATIVVRNTSKSQGRSGSSSMSYNRSARKLMTPDEVGRIGEKNCILFIRECLPFFGPKFDLVKHPNYKFTSDADSKNAFDVEKKFALNSDDDDSGVREVQPSEVEKERKKIKTPNFFAKISPKEFVDHVKEKARKMKEAKAAKEALAAEAQPNVEDLFAQAANNDASNGGDSDDVIGLDGLDESEVFGTGFTESESTSSRTSSAVPVLNMVNEDYDWSDVEGAMAPPMPDESKGAAPILDANFGNDDDEEDDFADTSQPFVFAPAPKADNKPAAPVNTSAPAEAPKKAEPAPKAPGKTPEAKDVKKDNKQQKAENKPKKPEKTKEQLEAETGDLLGMLMQGEEDFQKQKEASETATESKANEKYVEASESTKAPAKEPAKDNKQEPVERKIQYQSSSIKETSESHVTVKVEKKTLGSLLQPKKQNNATETVNKPCPGTIIENDLTESRETDNTHSAIVRKNKTLASATASSGAAKAVKQEETAEDETVIIEEENSGQIAAQIRQVGLNTEDDESDDDFGIAETAYYG